MKTFERASDGQLVVTLLAGEAAILKMILTEIRKLIAEPEADNAATQRLFPRAYLDPTAEESEADFQSMVHGDMVDSRIHAFDEVWELLDQGTVDDDDAIRLRFDAAQEERLLITLNDVRLALGALTGADRQPDEDDEVVEIEDLAGDVLDWLGAMVQEFVDLLLSETPTTGIE